MLGCRRWLWISISRRSWCSTWLCRSWLLKSTCSSSSSGTGGQGERHWASPPQALGPDLSEPKKQHWEKRRELPDPEGGPGSPMHPSCLERHDKLALLLAGEVHVAKLAPTKRPADVKVAQGPAPGWLASRGT